MKNQLRIGFVGQGYVGKNYANDFEQRGFALVRYSLEEEYRQNRELISGCGIVFIAVPTPTTPSGFDDSVVRESLALVGAGKIAVIKSTLLPGTTKRLQADFPDRIVLFSPEFLSEVTAAADATHPFANIIGIPASDRTYHEAAERVQQVLPAAGFVLTCDSTEAEVIKYAHNLNGYFQIILSNILFDTAQALGAEWEPIRKAIEADPYISSRYAQPIHKSGRGAGGHCFIKDFAAFRTLYEKAVPDAAGVGVLRALENKNLELLAASDKDQDIVRGVYGPANLQR